MPLKKKYPWNVLVFPAASEIGLEICRALGGCKEVVLHGACQPGENVAAFHFRRLHELPRIDAPDCLPRLQELIAAENIDALFPAYDDVLLWLAKNAENLEATVLAPDARTCGICRSKRATCDILRDLIPIPRLWPKPTSSMPFPVFVKPECGQGSQRARRIDSRAELDRVLAEEPDLLIMENLEGREYTVDCFTQRGRGVLSATARERVQTKNGIATITRPAELAYAKAWAEKISERLKLCGAWFFQIKEDASGQPRLLEVAPRIAGSMALGRAMGPNLPLLTLYEAAGHDLSIDVVPTHSLMMGRSLDARFLSDQPIGALYVDLDDTLILRGEVNTRLIALIFQCRNRKIPVYLLTRHKSDLTQTLLNYRLTQLFDRILHLKNDAVPKFEFIKEKDAVLIDDSFQERTTVKRHLGIRCYDASGAMCLLDERV